ncbi:sterile alpha motif domain-containing protein 3-like isoform X1 [Hydra vulgaris]|uniref:sterile alpha motif domain-containing protein 3-like isoform X1 n=1 Tax=Hydra vulgaris TaxID=6087 RepID=UPI0032EA3848
MKFLTLYDGVIKKAAKRCKKYCKYSRMINKYLEETLDNDKQQDWKVMFVTLLLPSLFGEKEELFFPLPKQQIPLSPVILSQDDEWNISVDKEVLFPKTICTFSAAFQAWFAAFWIFSIEFSKGLSNTYQFLEKVLLGGKGKVPNIVSKWGNRLWH